MKDKLKLILKSTWLTAVILIPLLETNIHASCFENTDSGLALITFLSFPLGTIFALFSTSMLALIGLDSSSNFLVWLLLVCGGYLQWFVILPALSATPELTLLNLRDSQASITSNKQKRRHSSKDLPKHQRLAASFDKHRR